MSNEQEPPKTPTPTDVDISVFTALSKKRRTANQKKTPPAAANETREESVSAENSTLRFDVGNYKQHARKLAKGIPLDEGVLHKKLGLYLTPLGNAREGWYNDGRGNKFFMNEANAHTNLKMCHMGMYLLSQARANSYQRHVNNGREYPPKSFDPDFRAAFECHANYIAGLNGLPSVTIGRSDPYVSLYKKYLRGFHTYTGVNMQLSRVACRVAIVRLGLDPELGKWCDDNDTIRIVTHAEANINFNSQTHQDDPRAILLQTMLMEWLTAHGVSLDEQQETMDYSTWPGIENVGTQVNDDDLVTEDYIARKLIHQPEASKGTTKDSRSRRIMVTANFSDSEDDDSSPPIPSDGPNHKTHYLVENRDDKVAAYEHIIHLHGNLELKYSTDTNINDYRLLPTKTRIACVLDRYTEIVNYLTEALNKDDANDDDGHDSDDSDTSSPSNKRQKTSNSKSKASGNLKHDDKTDPAFNPEDEAKEDPEDHDLSVGSN